MIEIAGKVNTARCYAKTVDARAVEQIRTMCNYSLTEGSTIRIMPDVHAGKGCTIGTTMTVTDICCRLLEHRERTRSIRSTIILIPGK